MTSPPFRKLLVVNRGEIACRIMRTAKQMNIGTVAVYSDADVDALHVSIADEAYRLGPPAAIESYLNIGRILEICRSTEVDSVHPGYGFLSEQREFADALFKIGVAFIGPNSAAIGAMGDKIESKRIASDAGVTVVPGYVGAINGPEDAKEIAGSIGYPVMIKATAGGGGKGMRIARSAADIVECVERARSEAAASFGDDRLFIEKFITNSRHIEIQILGDKHGNIIHLGERECSIQRRNQKVLEEAPSLLLDSATRQRMGEEAISLARAVGYDSAGTVEFVVAQDKSFYFLEMNTRLQVEHPVTEMVTGLDIVEEMILSAAGNPLRHQQSDICINGWAVESRICAEQPEKGFLPSGGSIEIFQPPMLTASLSTVRVDSGVRTGDTITSFYDPLFAKLITHAATREQAIDLQCEALDTFAVTGVATNIPFLSSLMRNKHWREGNISTALISEDYGDHFKPEQPDEAELLNFASVGVAVFLLTQLHWTSSDTATHLLSVIIDDVQIDCEVRLEGHAIIVEIAGKQINVTSKWKPGEPIWKGQVGGIDLAMQVSADANEITLVRSGFTTRLIILTPRQADLIERMQQRNQPIDVGLLAPMLGTIIAWKVAVGDSFISGDVLCIMEAMKMEMALHAECDGVVTKVNVTENQTVEQSMILMKYSKR